MKKSLLRFIICLMGLSGLGIIIAEMLRKWQFISDNRSPVWVAVPILILFTVNEVSQSPYIVNNSKISPNIFRISGVIINITLIILGILALISIPFVWFGTIQELAHSAD